MALLFSLLILSSITNAIAINIEKITIGIILFSTIVAKGFDGSISISTLEKPGISLALKFSAPINLKPCPSFKELATIIPIKAALL